MTFCTVIRVIIKIYGRESGVCLIHRLGITLRLSAAGHYPSPADAPAARDS